MRQRSTQTVVASEAESPSDKSVEIGRHDVVVAVSPNRVGALVIGQQKQDIWSFPRPIIAVQGSWGRHSRSSDRQFSKEIPSGDNFLIHLCLIPCQCLCHFRDRGPATAGNHTRAGTHRQAPRLQTDMPERRKQIFLDVQMADIV